MFSRTDIPRKESEEVGEHILTKAVKAGRRTYFFDVRATRGNDYYLTITESRKTTVADGSVVFDRHKIFLYKEDFAGRCCRPARRTPFGRDSRRFAVVGEGRSGRRAS